MQSTHDVPQRWTDGQPNMTLRARRAAKAQWCANAQPITVTVWNQPGTGTQVTLRSLEAFRALSTTLLATNTPFQVGHVFGNIDGSHPKRS
jgi:hypothetical protein